MKNHKTIDDIRKLSKQSRLVLFGEVEDRVETYSDSSSYKPATNTTPKTEVTAKALIDVEIKTVTQPMQNALDMINLQSVYNIPFLFRREAAALAKVKGGESLLRAENEALNAGVIAKHFLPRAKTNVCFWEITDSGYKSLKKTRPQWKSKGEYKHKFAVHRIEFTYEGAGFQSKIEHPHTDGKLVDLCVKKDDSMIFIEVCASWPVSKELVNVEKDLQSDLLPDELILAVTERKMRVPLQKAINELSDLPCPVKVMLAGDLISFLEI